jgi:hypothetical protein
MKNYDKDQRHWCKRKEDSCFLLIDIVFLIFSHIPPIEWGLEFLAFEVQKGPPSDTPTKKLYLPPHSPESLSIPVFSPFYFPLSTLEYAGCFMNLPTIAVFYKDQLLI